MDVKIDIQKIQKGMYVSELDRPWTDTNFLFQGFLIESDDQIHALREQCSYVIVSQEKSLAGIFTIPGNSSKNKKPTPASDPVIKQTSVKPGSDSISLTAGLTGLLKSIKQIGQELLMPRASVLTPYPATGFFPMEETEDDRIAEVRRKDEVGKIRQAYAKFGDIPLDIEDYPVKTTVEEELVVAKQTTEKLQEDLAASFILEMTGTDLSDRIEVAKDLLADVVESIIRNPNAMLLISSMKTMDNVTYRHAMDVAIMLVSFGRQLGLPRDELNEVALGGLLHDIGKSKIPGEMLNKTKRLDSDEIALARKHVPYGIEIVGELSHLSEIVRQIVERHHERYDGMGYPLGLKGEEIGLYGSMAGIVETFSTITSHQPYAPARSSAKAISTLVALRDQAFQSELVDQFIQVVGVYPIGSLVKLNTGEIGIVIKQNKLWRLQPMVTLVVDDHGKRLEKQRTIDLVKFNQDNENPISITTELPAGTFGIEPKDYFL